MFTRKQKAVSDTPEAEGNTTPAATTNPARGLYGIKKCHDPNDAIAE